VGIIGQVLKQNIEKFVSLVSEIRKGFNQNALMFTPAGDDSVPLKEERVVMVKVDGNGKYNVVGVLTPSQGAKPGEKIFFARDADGTIKSKITMLNDGSVNVENEGDRTEKYKGNADVKGDGNLTVTIKGDITFESDGTINQKAKGDFTSETTGKFNIKGTQVEISGNTEIILKTIGSALWCPNGVTNCYICGAPHGGPQMGIVGLKGA
jgi:hypothetical protein